MDDIEQQIDDLIEEWHAAPRSHPLSQHCGMTPQQFEAFARDCVIPEGYEPPPLGRVFPA